MTDAAGAQIDAARSVARVFSPARLTLARQVAGRTKSQLATAISKSPAAVTQFELGQAKPSGETLAACADWLGVPVQFFAAGRPQLVVDTGRAHFRSLRATRVYQREQAMGLASLLWEIVEAIDHVVELPSVNLLYSRDFTGRSTPTTAARQLRSLWNVVDGPFPHLVRHSEVNGVVAAVLPTTFAAAAAARSPEHPSGVGNVDAFSTRVLDRPLIGLTASKGGLLRRRFNVAHELGHLNLHAEARPGDARHEREAHLFAAELLMPQDAIADELPSRPDPSDLLELQHRWGVSISALGFRGRTLGKYTDSQLQHLMVTLSRLGWRTNEPEDRGTLRGEEPALLRDAVELAATSGFSVVSLAKELALPTDMVRQFAGLFDRRPRLTLVTEP